MLDKRLRTPTCNITKSGEVLNWGGFIPFQLHLGLIRNRSEVRLTILQNVVYKR